MGLNLKILTACFVKNWLQVYIRHWIELCCKALYVFIGLCTILQPYNVQATFECMRVVCVCIVLYLKTLEGRLIILKLTRDCCYLVYISTLFVMDLC